MTSIDQDFQDAQLGRGTRQLTISETIALLDYCAAIGWAFQTMEASECINEREYPRVDLSILGLTQVEKASASFDDLIQIARDRLAKAQAEANTFVFQVWIDLPDSIIAKANADRPKA